MPETRPPFDDGINLIDLFEILWDSKWKIVGAIVFSVLSIFVYQSFQAQPYFMATTQIKPLISSDVEKYRLSNKLAFVTVTRDTLMNLFVDQLEDRVHFREAIRKYELLDTEKFENEENYNEAVIKFASSIEIYSPDKKKYWEIVGHYDDASKWKQLLVYVDSSANESVKKGLQAYFKNTLVGAKLQKRYELEDISTKVENAYADYDRDMSDKLFFLKEQ